MDCISLYIQIMISYSLPPLLTQRPRPNQRTVKREPLCRGTQIFFSLPASTSSPS